MKTVCIVMIVILMVTASLIAMSHFASGFQYDDEQKYPPVNVTKFMSIVENSTTFKEKINGYVHYSLATVILKPESQNTSNPTMEYNLVYSLYKNSSDYCSYDKVLVITLNVQLQIINTTEYSPYGVPSGYPLPPVS
ncbi:MAG: hypothetical protein WA833_02100 [Nitrosotalea sp.]